jgi:hypothetical protein
MCEYLKSLQRPFPAEDIEWRVSHASKTHNGFRALVLAYVTNRAIMERLDEVFGIAGWKNEYSEWRDKGVKCTLTCKVGDEWIAKEDGADVTDMEATKGGFSASMKRTAVQWGIGRYLYNLGQTWVNIKDKGQNYISTSAKVGQGKEFVKGYWDTPKLPQWALPEGYEIKEAEPQEAGDYNFDDLELPPSLDEDAAALEAETKRNIQGQQPADPQQSNIKLASEGQVKMLYAKFKYTGYSDMTQIINFLQRDITKFAEVPASDVTRLAQWLDKQKAA